MSLFSTARRVLTAWYVVAPLLAGLGIAAGALTFVYASPGKPQIGIIDIPFTVITEDSAYVIGRMLDYAREDDSIQAVVIKLTSPGGGAAASEQLYLETRRLRAEKPVVVVMNGLVASGGYMMSMGTSHLYVKPSSLVGNVGVVSGADPLIPPVPGEDVVFSGPHKLDGASRRDWIGMVDQLKSAFAQTVISERGERLRISRDELVEARIYSGLDAVRLGLADDIGSDRDAIQKAGELAGVSNYGLVDVNLEVQIEVFEELARILEPLEGGDGSGTIDALEMLLPDPEEGDSALQAFLEENGNGVSGLQALRGLMLERQMSTDQADPLPDFPLGIGQPNFYYLYVGNGS
ncbi:MAG: S49 family peptidase [Chloroflexota bacterium]|nr:S49 family peptidase [Chloroflexota bacterium]